MSLIAFVGALEMGLIFGLVALGVFVSFRVLRFPDLTVDGSFVTGAAVCAVGITQGMNPYLATAAGAGAAAFAGFITGILNVRFRILHLLAGILTMIALYTVNIRIMDGPNIPLLGVSTVFDWARGFGLPYYVAQPIVIAILTFGLTVGLVLFLRTELGLAMRAAGSNPRVAQMQGVSVGLQVLIGLAISNALVGTAGALFAQANGGTDVTIGIGLIVAGIASLIIGEAVMSTRTVFLWVVACLAGALLYRVAIAFALNVEFLGLKPHDLNLITALLVIAALILPGSRNPVRGMLDRRKVG